MASRDINQTTTTSNTLQDYSVDPLTLDSTGDQKETEYVNTNWSTQLGYYKQIPELKQAIDAIAMWCAGRGWTADIPTKVILEKIMGWGEDSFQSIMMNAIRTKKIGGDAFIEIIRNTDTGTLINLKPLNPGDIKIVTNKAGLIIRYEQINRTNRRGNKRFTPDQILHLCNDRVGDEIHGVSVIDAVENVILARNEAMTDYRKVLHRNINPLKIFELDTDQANAVANFKTQYENMTKDYEALIVPKGNAQVTIPSVPIQNPQAWIQYLESFFYSAVGVPKAILGGTQDFTEAASKTAVFTFEQTWQTEQMELETDLWNQLGVRVKFNRPQSMKEDIQTNEAANGSQVGFQPNDTNVGAGA